MRRLFALAVIFILLAACGPDRAQTIDPPAATPTPPPMTATAEPQPTAESTEVPPTLTPAPATATPELNPTKLPTKPPPSPTATIEVQPTETATEVPTAVVQPTEQPTQAPPAGAAEIDQQALMASLLTLADMPTGWTSKAPVFELRTPGGTYTSFCTQLTARSIAAAYVDFEKSGLGPFMTHSIIVYPDSANARAAYDDLVAAAQSCPQVTDNSGSTNTLSPLSFPSLGEATFAVRSSGTVEMDAVNILVENVLISIRHAAFGAAVDSAQTEAFARAAVDKYQ